MKKKGPKKGVATGKRKSMNFRADIIKAQLRGENIRVSEGGSNKKLKEYTRVK